MQGYNTCETNEPASDFSDTKDNPKLSKKSKKREPNVQLSVMFAPDMVI